MWPQLPLCLHPQKTKQILGPFFLILYLSVSATNIWASLSLEIVWPWQPGNQIGDLYFPVNFAISILQSHCQVCSENLLDLYFFFFHFLLIAKIFVSDIGFCSPVDSCNDPGLYGPSPLLSVDSQYLETNRNILIRYRESNNNQVLNNPAN